MFFGEPLIKLLVSCLKEYISYCKMYKRAWSYVKSNACKQVMNDLNDYFANEGYNLPKILDSSGTPIVNYDNLTLIPNFKLLM